MGVKTSTTLVGVVLIGAGLAVAPATADDVNAASETTAPVPAALRVAIDPETGELRALRGAEVERLSAAVRAELERAGALGPEAPIVTRADGSRTKRLDARYAHWLTARASDSGPVGHCDAGTAYLANRIAPAGKGDR